MIDQKHGEVPDEFGPNVGKRDFGSLEMWDFPIVESYTNPTPPAKNDDSYINDRLLGGRVFRAFNFGAATVQYIKRNCFVRVSTMAALYPDVTN